MRVRSSRCVTVRPLNEANAAFVSLRLVHMLDLASNFCRGICRAQSTDITSSYLLFVHVGGNVK